MRVATFAAVVALLAGPVACSSSSGSPGDSGPPATAAKWVVSRVNVPETASTASQYGLDLNGDGVVDNQFGRVLAVLGFSVQAAMDGLVARGEVIRLARVVPTTGTHLTLSFGAGTVLSPSPCTDLADTVCGHHLDGFGTFAAGALASLPGQQLADVITAGPADVTVPFTWGGPIIDLPLQKAILRVDRNASPVRAVLAGGISMSTISTVLLPGLASTLQAVVARDCPTPTSCMSGSEGASVLALFDADHDGVITVTELTSSALLSTLLAPDLDLDAVPAGGDALSFGVGLQFVSASF